MPADRFRITWSPLGSFYTVTRKNFAGGEVVDAADYDALAAESLPAFLERQRAWSEKTFGEGKRTLGISAHIVKEVAEIAAKPEDLSEWVDVLILALDGYWRHGGKPEEIMKHLQAKQDKNFARGWPPPSPEDVAVEHLK